METHEDFKKRLGLLPGTPVKEVAACSALLHPIHHLTPKETEDKRKRLAILNKLPENAGWVEIIRAKFEFGRKETAKELGLAEESSWNEIAQTVIKQEESKGGERSDITIAVSFQLGVRLNVTPKASWDGILRGLKNFGISVEKIYLKPIFERETLLVGATYGTEKLSDLFGKRLYGINTSNIVWRAAPAVTANMFEQVSGGTHSEILSSLGNGRPRCQNPGQVLGFCRNHPEKLKPNEVHTFFELVGGLVVGVFSGGGLPLEARVDPLSDSRPLRVPNHFVLIGSGEWN